MQTCAIPPAARAVEPLFERATVRTVRTFRRFAEEEFVLATGPRRGMRFQVDFMPWTGLILDEFDRRRFRRFFLTGPAQAAKTTIGFTCPILYHLFETEERVICGVPQLYMAQGIWEERILPAIHATRYSALLPKRGSGSRGGKFISITFENGATLRFMAAGGGDAQRSSFDARVIVATEIDKMDQPGETSREADPVTQLETRSQAYGSRALLYAECTMSTELGRVYREVKEFGSDSTFFFRCPHCRRPIPLERENFLGWQDASDVVTARAKAFYLCPNCKAVWKEEDRRAALREPVMVSKGQTVNAAGEIEGVIPPTNTFGVRWTAMASSLLTMGDIAEKEHRTERSQNPSDAKAIHQFVWALPWSEDLVDLSGISVRQIQGKAVGHPRGVVPDKTSKLILAIDLGLYRCYWALLGFRDEAFGHVVDYGSIEVPQERQGDPLRILASLRAFRDDVVEPGWSAGRRPDLVLVDSGWKPDIVYPFVKESGQRQWMAAKGFGSGRDQQSWRPPRATDKARQAGNEWALVVQPGGIRLFEFNADYWKGAVHEGFAAEAGLAGSITLYHASPKEHYAFARSIVAERREQEFVPGKGERTFWNRLWKDNHYLDCCSMARAGADLLGIRMVRPDVAPVPAAAKRVNEASKSRWKIRTRY